MKESLIAIYNTLGKIQMPNTPSNVKYMAGIYVKLEELIQEEEKREKQTDE